MAGCVALVTSGVASAAAEIVIINLDEGTGAGLDDPELGAQRMAAMEYAAAQISPLIDSTVSIRIRVKFTDRGCNGGGALLGTAGSVGGAIDNPTFHEQGVLYPQALANAMAGEHLNGEGTDGQGLPVAEIEANFNTALDDPGCASNWCYELDNLEICEAASAPLWVVANHEFVHGLGFATFVNKDPEASAGQLGAFPDIPGLGPVPDIFSLFAYDLLTGQTWENSTQAERAASITAENGLAWSGAEVSLNAPTFLVDVGGTLQGTHADTGYMLMYTPDEVVASSVSHWTTDVAEPLLMEPVIQEDTAGGEGLWLSLLEDLGWNTPGLVPEPEPEPEPVPVVSTGPQTDGGTITESNACAVSEPGGSASGSSALLIGLGALALFGIRRRKK